MSNHAECPSDHANCPAGLGEVCLKEEVRLVSLMT